MNRTSIVPEIFNISPEYATYQESLHILFKSPSFSAFGFGSCIYPGKNVAERSLSLLVTHRLSLSDAEGK